MKRAKFRNYDNYIVDTVGPKETSSFYELIYYLGGHNDKTFVLCESEFFREFFDEITNNPNHTYSSYLNQFISENYKGKTIPISEVGAFKKVGENNFIEEVVSRLANALKIKTTYIKNAPQLNNEIFQQNLMNLIKNGKAGDSIKYEPEDYLLSPDFLSEGEHFDTIDAYCKNNTNECVCPRRCSLATWYNVFKYRKFTNPLTREILSPDQKMQLLKELIPQFVFRAHLVKDWDFKSENVGIIYNENTNQYSLAPMFDFEYCYYLASQNDYRRCAEDLIFAYKCCPKETTEVIEKIVNFNIDGFLNHYYDNNEYLDPNQRPHSTNRELIRKHFISFLDNIRQFSTLEIF